jgi:hypothetical protein
VSIVCRRTDIDRHSTKAASLVGFPIMNQSIRSCAHTVVLVIVFLAFSTSFASAEDTVDEVDGWDQAKVTSLANELEKSLEDSYAQIQTAPPQQTAMQQRNREAAQGVVRRARDLSADLATKIRAGWGRTESEPYFRMVAEEVAHIWDTAGDAVPTESAQPRIDRMQQILSELRAAYDAP